MKGFHALVILITALFAFSSCDIYEFKPREGKEKKLDKVMILYQAGYNSLSSDLRTDIWELTTGSLPAQGDDKAILIVGHHCASYSDYRTKTEPCIIRLYRDKQGNAVLDTLVRYPGDDLLTSKEVMARSLSYIAETFKSDHYGLIVASHGTGWLPAGYYASPDSYELSTLPSGGPRMAAPRYGFPSGAIPYIEPEPMPGPRVRTFGEEIFYQGSTKSSLEMDIKDLKDALPFHLDYLLMDVCLMGCVEVAYELKDCCDYLGFSPTEILADGFEYSKIASRLLKTGDPDLKGVLDDYYEIYAAQTGEYRSACFTLVRCDKLEALATACRSAFEAGREQLAQVRPSSIQPYFRSYHHWFYDLEDVLEQAGIPHEAVKTALQEAVSYEVHTDSFMPRSGGFNIRTYCGLSLYLPCDGSEYLDAYYRTLAWNRATALVQ